MSDRTIIILGVIGIFISVASLIYGIVWLDRDIKKNYK